MRHLRKKYAMCESLKQELVVVLKDIGKAESYLVEQTLCNHIPKVYMIYICVQTQTYACIQKPQEFATETLRCLAGLVLYLG